MIKSKDLLLKVLSLGIGLAVGIVLIAKVCFELSYDSAYPGVDRVYRIMTGISMNGENRDYGQVSGAVAPGFRSEVPGVEAATRTTFVFDTGEYLDEEDNRLSGTLVCADTSFFAVFGRQILAGDPVKALGKWGCVMVSRSFADKMGGLSCIGKTLRNVDMEGLSMTIEGIFEDLPKNGSLHYDILLSMETFGRQSTENWLGNDRYLAYVKLYDGVDPHSLSDAIKKMQLAHQPLDEMEKNGTVLWYHLLPFDRMHTSDPEVKSQIILLSIVAFLLLLISLLNYILLVIATIVKRSREVGIRKCYGAERKDIYAMLGKEASLHLLLSGALAAIIILAARSLIENLLGVPFPTLLVPQSIGAIAAMLAIVLLASIVVPARLYQRLPVYAALKNHKESSRKWKLGLLGVEVLVNVFMAAMLLVISLQYEKAAGGNPGYDYENLYYVNLYDYDYYAKVRVTETLRNFPEVLGVESCNSLPFMGSSGDNVYLPGDDRELFNFADQYEATEGFYSLLGMEFTEGRAPRDSSEVAVSESFVRKMAEFADWSDGAVGKEVVMTGHDRLNFTISGVYKDILIGNLIDADKRPSARFWGETGKTWMPHIIFKLSRKDKALLDKIYSAVTEALEGKEKFLISYESSMRSAYEDSRKMRSTLVLGTVFSLVLALIGLVGFIRDESLRRSKEMALRKINGSSSREIILIFVGDILKISAVMALLADALVWIAAHEWLKQFSEKIALSPWIFIAADLLVLFIVSLAVALNCLRIARANPVESLRNE